jgi:hypothetical protein
MRAPTRHSKRLPKRPFAFATILVSAITLQGCVASTLVDVATAPVRVASKAVDLATTSQSEADEKRGRAMRKAEEELGKLQRRYDKELEKCRDGDDRKCFEARETYSEIQIAKRSLPQELPE